MHHITGHGKNVTAVNVADGISNLKFGAAAKNYVKFGIAVVMDIITRGFGSYKTVFQKHGFISITYFYRKLTVHNTFPKKT